MPPLLWKRTQSALPGWSEIDNLPYREVTSLAAQSGVYEIVRAWKEGRAMGNPSLMSAYAELVGQGIVTRIQR